MITKQEFKEKLTAMITNPDTAAAAAGELEAAVSEVFAGYDEQRVELEKRDERIRDLQDTNVKLFLQQTHPANDEPGEELNAEDELEKLLKERS